jgi:hypothetical protein
MKNTLFDIYQEKIKLHNERLKIEEKINKLENLEISINRKYNKHIKKYFNVEIPLSKFEIITNDYETIWMDLSTSPKSVLINQWLKSSCQKKYIIEFIYGEEFPLVSFLFEDENDAITFKMTWS